MKYEPLPCDQLAADLASGAKYVETTLGRKYQPSMSTFTGMVAQAEALRASELHGDIVAEVLGIFGPMHDAAEYECYRYGLDAALKRRALYRQKAKVELTH